VGLAESAHHLVGGRAVAQDEAFDVVVAQKASNLARYVLGSGDCFVQHAPVGLNDCDAAFISAGIHRQNGPGECL